MTSKEWVELFDSSGESLVGALHIPPHLSNHANTTLMTFLMSNTPSSVSQSLSLASSVLNITLLDGQGNFITKLESPLTICFALPNKTKKGRELCLSYFDERKGKWKCEDQCLTSVVTKGANSVRAKEEKLLCGETSHLTNFALLLVSNKREYPCQSSENGTLAWISLGMVCGAVLIVALSVLVVELHFRWKMYQLDKQLTKACLQVVA